ncbi:MAG TPA: NRAMP family divalent metal transporter [Chloroflexota bacterium]
MTQHLDTFVPAAPAAALDDAHVGDIRGALGTIRQHDHVQRHTWKGRLLALLAIMGPGLIVMVGDNDAGGVATYAQAGQNFGTSLLWTLLLLIPILIVNQEMVVRLGAVTGVGHARLINERFGRFWGLFSVGDLFILNFLTIVTEFIGISLAMSHFGVSPTIAVPAFALLLVGMTVTGSFRTWERFMYVFIALNFLAIPLVFMSHPRIGPVVHDTLVPHIAGGIGSTSILLIIAIVGTTVAPWQLFFQQSNVVDKRITPRWLNYERADTVIGSVVVVLGAASLMSVTAFAFGGTTLAGRFGDAGTVAAGLSHQISPLAGDMFALILLNASLIGAAAVTLSTSYAFGDVFEIKHSLHRSVRDGKTFYAIYGLLVVFAAGIVVIPNVPLGLITLAVQALAGLLLPSATVFLVLLCNDRAVLGPWVNRIWLNVVASVIVGVLVMLSLMLAVETLFPAVDAVRLMIVLGVVLVAALIVSGMFQLRSGRADTRPETQPANRTAWRMPPLDTLPKPAPSLPRTIGLISLRGYLVMAALALLIKVIGLALGH